MSYSETERNPGCITESVSGDTVPWLREERYHTYNHVRRVGPQRLMCTIIFCYGFFITVKRSSLGISECRGGECFLGVSM